MKNISTFFIKHLKISWSGGNKNPENVSVTKKQQLVIKEHLQSFSEVRMSKASAMCNKL